MLVTSEIIILVIVYLQIEYCILIYMIVPGSTYKLHFERSL